MTYNSVVFVSLSSFHLPQEGGVIFEGKHTLTAIPPTTNVTAIVRMSPICYPMDSRGKKRKGSVVDLGGEISNLLKSIAGKWERWHIYMGCLLACGGKHIFGCSRLVTSRSTKYELWKPMPDRQWHDSRL